MTSFLFMMSLLVAMHICRSKLCIAVVGFRFHSSVCCNQCYWRFNMTPHESRQMEYTRSKFAQFIIVRFWCCSLNSNKAVRVLYCCCLIGLEWFRERRVISHAVSRIRTRFGDPEGIPSEIISQFTLNSANRNGTPFRCIVLTHLLGKSAMYYRFRVKPRHT